MSKQTAVAKAVRFSLFAFVSSAVSGTVIAQDTAVAGEKVERIEVTGSRIQRTDMETSSPVTVIDRAEIDASGVATLSDFVRNLASNSFGSFRDASGFGSGQSSQSTVSLRGLGANRTLVLIDGRRMGTSVAFGGGTQNLNVIPMAAVERVEVLRDGASAVYGSDAVAGVINIITKKEYEGVDIEAEQGITQHGGGDNTNVRMTFGSVGEKTNIVASVEYFNRGALYDDQRNFSNYLPSSYGWPGSGTYNEVTLDDKGEKVYTAKAFANEKMCVDANGIWQEDPKTGNAFCKYNAAGDSATMAAQERFSSFVKVDHEFNDDLKWTNRLMMTRVWTEGQYAGTPNSADPVLRRTDANKDVYDATIAALGSEHQWIKEQAADGKYTNIDLLMRTTPLGPRVTSVEDTDINFLTALEGYSELMGGMTWDVGAQWIRSDVSTVQTGTANSAIIQDLLDSGELDFFGAGPNYKPGQNETAIQKAAHTAVFTGRVQTYGIDGGVSFDMFDVPAGTVPIALGMEWNRTEYDKLSDAASNLGDVIGSSGGDIIQGKSREVFSASAETLIPIFDGLDFEASARFDDYSDFGSTFNPKLGLSYRPVDSLLVRVSWGTGFRAPTFDDLYAQGSLTNLWAIDKVSGNTTQEQYPAYYMGNENLEPEESESLSIGAVWNVTDAFDLELSYYDIQIDDVITTMTSQDIFDMELELGADAVKDWLFRKEDGSVDYLLLPKMNLGEMNTSGIDLNANYLLETGVGEFRFRAETNYVITWEEKKGPDSPMEDIVGELGSPQYRINLSTTWTQDEWDASLFARYTASQEETYLDKDKNEQIARTDGQWILDAQVGYHLAWNAKIDFGIRNLLDEEPPLNDYLGFPGYDTYLYDPIGREYYLRYNQKF